MSNGKPAPNHADIKDMSFERALKELEAIVGRLERGDVELEESIAIYERGEQLRDHCDRLLKAGGGQSREVDFCCRRVTERHRQARSRPIVWRAAA